METKGKRASRVMRPPVIPNPQAVAEAPAQVLPPELTQTTSAATSESPEAAVERVSPPAAPTSAAPHVEPADVPRPTTPFAPIIEMTGVN